jgi:hypothetical protein
MMWWLLRCTGGADPGPELGCGKWMLGCRVASMELGEVSVRAVVLLGRWLFLGGGPGRCILHLQSSFYWHESYCVSYNSCT